MNTYKWSKAISRDNQVIKTLSNAQHRALSLLATFEIKLKDNEAQLLNNEAHTCKAVIGFFNKALPIMLYAAKLPELNLSSCFEESIDVYGIEGKVREYLRYIDRKYGTWYEPIEPQYVA